MRIGLLIFALVSSLAAGRASGIPGGSAAQAQSAAGLESMRRKAEKAEGGDRARLYVELAQVEVQEAGAKFTAGDADRAQAEIKDAANDADVATQAAIGSRKRLKQTEIAIHELARRLDSIEHSLTAEDRPPVKVAVERLQTMTTNLLQAMFKKK